MRRRTLAALCLSPGLPAFECPDLRTVHSPREFLVLPYRNHTDQWVLRDLSGGVCGSG